MTEQPSPEQMKEFQEKIEKMSPEEKKAFFRQQCIFCQIIDGKIDSMKVYEDDKTLAILDINPANPGHVLLMPKEHHMVGPQVPKDEMAHMGIISKAISNCCLNTLKSDGTSIFIANGIAAGQRAQHFMIHVIPRKEKDGLLTLPEHDAKGLEELAANLRDYISKKLKVKVEEEPVKKQEESIEEKPVKEKGYLYFVDKEGDISRCKMVRGRKKEKQKKEKVIKLGIKREPGLLYYVDKDLNVKTSKMNRGRKAGKKKAKKTTAKKPSKKKVVPAEVVEKKEVSLDDISNLFT